MKCKDCKDKLNCDYYMNDYPGGNPFTKKQYCEKKEYKVGDWIWLIESIDELNRKRLSKRTNSKEDYINCTIKHRDFLSGKRWVSYTRNSF